MTCGFIAVFLLCRQARVHGCGNVEGTKNVTSKANFLWRAIAKAQRRAEGERKIGNFTRPWWLFPCCGAVVHGFASVTYLGGPISTPIIDRRIEPRRRRSP